MSDLTSRLDRLLEFHDEVGSPARSGLGPGLTDAQLNKMEARLGYQLLPEIREFMAWQTCVPDGIQLLPQPLGSWLQPNFVMQSSTNWALLDYWDGLPEWGRPGESIQLVRLFTGFSAIDHAEGPTKGGVFNTDGGAEGWLAPSFSHLIDVCLEYIERGWVELLEGVDLVLNAAASAAAADKEAQFRADNPDFEGHLFLTNDLRSFRLAGFEDPSLYVHGQKHWIW